MKKLRKRILAGLLALSFSVAGIQNLARLPVQADDILAGSGTEDDPYRITSAADLSTMQRMVDGGGDYAAAHYRLETDLDLSGVAYVPIGRANAFRGVFDGQSHTISNLTVSDWENYTGFFGQVIDGTVRNLGIAGGELKGGSRVGGIAGYTERATIENCFNTATIYGGDAGGIVGTLYVGTVVRNCYNLGAIDPDWGGSSIGGVAGYAGRGAETQIVNCYNAGKIGGSGTAGAITGFGDPMTYQNVYYDTASCAQAIGNMSDENIAGKTTAEMKAAEFAALLNDNRGGDLSLSAWHANTGAYPTFTGADSLLAGSGTEDDPYQIHEYADLQLMQKYIDSLGGASACYRLMEDLDLSGIDFQPIQGFAGVFDGDDHYVENLTIEGDRQVGFFSVLNNAVIRNFGIESGSISGSFRVGAIAGEAYGTAILNCYNRASVSGADVGGLTGLLQRGTIGNCYNSGAVGGTTTVGGISGYAGTAGTVIVNTYNTGLVSGSSYVGGVAGFIDPMDFENVFFNERTCASAVGNQTGIDGITALSTADMMLNKAFTERLNDGLTADERFRTWYTTDSYPTFNLHAPRAENPDAVYLVLEVAGMEQPRIEDGRLVLPESGSERYQLCVGASDNEQVIAPDGALYQPLTDQTVQLTYGVRDTQNGTVTLDTKTIPVTVSGKYKAENGDNPCPTVSPSLREWKGGTGSFRLSSQSRLVLESEKLRSAGEKIQYYFLAVLGRNLPISVGTPETGDLFLSLEANRDELGDEGYYLEIGDVLAVRGGTELAVMYGGVSVTQILYQDEEHTEVPKGLCRDYPAYAVRGAMLDTTRKWVELDYVEDIALYMAWFKMNELQLHLSDDSGEGGCAFRIESKKYPALNSSSYYYTQEEYKAFQKRVAEYGVSIVSEIEMPGHATVFGKVDSSLLVSGSSDLDLTNPAAEAFLKDLLDEFLDGEDPVFQNGKVHLGGDEYWVGSSEQYVQFEKMITDYVLSKGYTPEIWGNLTARTGSVSVSTDAVLTIWDPAVAYADDLTAQGYSVINSDSSYLYVVPGVTAEFNDYAYVAALYEEWDVSNFTKSSRAGGYRYCRLLPGNPHVLGAKSCLWNDNVYGTSENDMFDRMVDQLAIVSEKTWYGDTDAYASGADFEAAFDQTKHSAPVDPSSYVESRSDTVARYDFENVSGTTVTDESDNGYHASLQEGASVVAVDGGHAMELDAGYLSLPFEAVGYPYTVSFDLYLEEGHGDGVLFDGSKGTLKLNSSNALSYSRGMYRFSVDGLTLENDRWQHIVITCDKKSLTVLVDGVAYRGTLANSLTTNFVLPTERIGAGLLGYLDNLTIVQKATACAAEPDWKGTGTAEDPYQIGTANDLLTLSAYASDSDFGSASYILTNDIDLEGYGFSPIGGEMPFRGSFDGGGYTIYHLNVNTDQTNAGLFGTLEGVVKNLRLQGGSITGSGYSGGIAGTVRGGVILNCVSTAAVNGQTAGGLSGLTEKGYIANSACRGRIGGESTAFCGGISGETIGGSTLVSATFSGTLNGGTADGVTAVREDSVIENAYDMTVADGPSMVTAALTEAAADRSGWFAWSLGYNGPEPDVVPNLEEWVTGFEPSDWLAADWHYTYDGFNDSNLTVEAPEEYEDGNLLHMQYDFGQNDSFGTMLYNFNYRHIDPNLARYLTFYAYADQETTLEISLGNWDGKYTTTVTIGTEPRIYSIDFADFQVSSGEAPIYFIHLHMYVKRSQNPGAASQSGEVWIDNIRTAYRDCAQDMSAYREPSLTLERADGAGEVSLSWAPGLGRIHAIAYWINGVLRFVPEPSQGEFVIGKDQLIGEICHIDALLVSESGEHRITSLDTPGIPESSTSETVESGAATESEGSTQSTGNTESSREPGVSSQGGGNASNPTTGETPFASIAVLAIAALTVGTVAGKRRKTFR